MGIRVYTCVCGDSHSLGNQKVGRPTGEGGVRKLSDNPGNRTHPTVACVAAEDQYTFFYKSNSTLWSAPKIAYLFHNFNAHSCLIAA